MFCVMMVVLIVLIYILLGDGGFLRNLRPKLKKPCPFFILPCPPMIYKFFSLCYNEFNTFLGGVEMTTNVDLEKLQKDAVEIFNQGFACSESVIYAIKKNFELDMSDDAIAMSSGFPWGLGGGGCICGALAGATMCIGYFFGRKTPGDPKVNRCFKLSNEIHDFFKEYCGATCCRVLTKGKEKNSPERKAQCTDFVAATVKKTAEIILRELALDEAEG